MSHQCSPLPGGDPPWAGWTTDVTTGTRFRETLSTLLPYICIRQNSEKNYHFYPHLLETVRSHKAFWFPEHKESHRTLMCRKTFAAFFLQGTHWNRGDSHQTLMHAFPSQQIPWRRTAIEQSTQMLSEVVLIPSCGRSTNLKALAPDPAENFPQGSHYNIMGQTTVKKNLELVTQKCEWGSLVLQLVLLFWSGS